MRALQQKIILIPFALVMIVLGWWLLKDEAKPYESILSRQVTPDAELPEGFMVWSSNRRGNHDIFKMTLPDKKITRLSKHPHNEYFPRISPDGKYVIFARAQKPKQSFNDQISWDVVLLNLQTGKERVVTKSGNFPTWSSDGERVYFQRQLFQFVGYDLGSGKEKLVFASGRGQVKEKAGLQTPHLSPDGEYLAVTLRFSQNFTGIIDPDGDVSRIAGGCQLTWNQTGDFLYFVDYGGRMKNAIYVYELDKGKPQMWLDLPGKFSHEYFPKLSNDERYMVFGASRSAKAHAHDLADYEMFLWQIGTPVENVKRLTFNERNDNWPDIYLYQN